jgi:hypothetical protein
MDLKPLASRWCGVFVADVDFSQPMQDELRSRLVLRMQRGMLAARRVEAAPGRKISLQSAGPSSV